VDGRLGPRTADVGRHRAQPQRLRQQHQLAPVAAAAYLGVARGAYQEEARVVVLRDDPAASVVRQLGEMQARLRVASWALLGAVDEVGDDPAADEATLATLMTAKRHAVLEAIAVVDTALEVPAAPPSSARRRWSGPTATCAVGPSTR
jgi:hypothetical protein